MPKRYDDDLPIPTYEEATSSRPQSSQSLHGSSNADEHAERQGLLGRSSRSTQANNYQQPTVESARSSYETSLSDLHSTDDAAEEEELRRDIEEMEMMDGNEESTAQQRTRMRRGITKRLASIQARLSSLHLPSIRIPSIASCLDRLPTVAPGYRPSWPILARLFGLFCLVAIIYGLILAHSFRTPRRAGLHVLPESVRQFVQAGVDGENIRQYLRQISYDDHMAGTNGDYYLARKIEDHFKAAHFDEVYRDTYEVYLNYPKPGGRRVAIVEPEELAWEAKLEENKVDQRPDPDHKVPRHQTLVFHGHSRSGDVTGPLIYANYGSKEDFARLKEMGIDLTGAIVLVRYFGSQGDRAIKVKLAELAGAAGCLIYSDPKDDGFLKGETWPKGRWRTRDSVQRGAVSLMSWVVGDVLTPGYPSLPENDRFSTENNPGLVNIPSLPLSWGDAQPLLQALKGHGARVPKGWEGGVPDVEWWTGKRFYSPQVHLKNEQEEIDRHPIQNIIGKIEGLENRESVIYVGNHRDAWCFGAVDPGSGTATFMEVVRVFGKLLEAGWRPRRSIVFASWDAEEYNLIGSTEHVEERIDELRATALAYLNLDTGVSGEEFWAAASPLFERPLLRVLNRVNDPRTNQTLKHLWKKRNARIEGLGAGSDYVAFQDLAGCSSIDFGFRGQPHSTPYHSCYETFDWMEKFGDPGFRYHEALAQVWALLILQFSDESIVPYDFNAYAEAVHLYVRGLKLDAGKLLSDAGAAPSSFNVEPLEDAADLFVENAKAFMEQENEYSRIMDARNWMESLSETRDRIYRNERMAYFETALLDLPQSGDRQGGIPGREQFKHVIFGPQAWSGYDEAYFPAVRDALEAGNWTAAQKQLQIAADVLQHAADKLLH